MMMLSTTLVAKKIGKVFDFETKNKKYKLIPIYHTSPLNPKGYKDNIEIFETIKSISNI